MELTVTSGALIDAAADLLLIPLPSDELERRLGDLSDRLDPSVGRLSRDFSGEKDEQVVGYPEDARIARIGLVGLGSLEALTLEQLRRSMAAGADIAQDLKTADVAVRMPEAGLGEAWTQAVVEGFVLGEYRFTRYKTGEEDGFEGVRSLTLVIPGADEAHERAARRGLMVSEATATARDLVNLSPDEKTATDFGRYVSESAREHGYRAEVWDRFRIKAEEMGGLLAVNRGSPEPPTFSVLEWKPDRPQNSRPIVLVGKGVMFDTGGLSLKSTKGSMDKMKSDMAGAAAVVGALEAVASLELPVHLVGLIPATDNRPGENAFVPGDVVHMHSGRTVEVLNTDAEGRLILADALSYARQFDPRLVIDLATLTGAQVVALGAKAAAVFTAEHEKAEERLAGFRAAGRRSGDRVEPLPMYEEYEELLESAVADVKNVGGRAAGAITAAKFLEKFVSYPWIHVDMAGPAFFESASNYRPEGGTGFGVRLLVEYVREDVE
jgi:leucyl aminopeptidase